MKKHEISRMELEPAENGGHTITLYYKAKPRMNTGSMRGGIESGYVEPTKHVFGKDDHAKMMAHISEHMGLKESARDEEMEEKASPGIHKKVAAMEAKEDE